MRGCTPDQKTIVSWEEELDACFLKGMNRKKCWRSLSPSTPSTTYGRNTNRLEKTPISLSLLERTPTQTAGCRAVVDGVEADRNPFHSQMLSICESLSLALNRRSSKQAVYVACLTGIGFLMNVIEFQRRGKGAVFDSTKNPPLHPLD